MNSQIKENISLKEYNTMCLDSTARYFLDVEKEEDLIEGLKHVKENNIDFLVIGGGSNIIFPEKYNGLVIFLKMKNYQIKEMGEKIILSADAGLSLPDASKAVNEKLGKGLEWAGGVPGTIGGAVRGNAGAFNDFMADCVLEVEALNVDTLEKEFFKNEECHFDYRESIFKKEKKYIVLKVVMEFSKKEKDDGIFEKYLNYRKENHPEEPSSGSVFKNPVVGDDFYEKFKETEKFRELGFIPMRFLIEKCGLKGEKKGGAKISEKHANFIINEKDATGEDVKHLISLIKKRVKERFQIDVQEEVEII
jgi:UDP-N-acetylmuramate dehydrogenase